MILSVQVNIRQVHDKIAILSPGFLDCPKSLKMHIFAETLSTLGYATCIVDPCGLWYGKQHELYTLKGYLRDIRRALGIMKNRVLKPKNILLLGHSIGGYLSVIAAHQNPEVSQLAIFCAPSDLSFIAKDENWKNTGIKISKRTNINHFQPKENRTFELPYSLAEEMLQSNALDLIGKISANTMFFTALDDEVVPQENSSRLIKAACQENVAYQAEIGCVGHHFNYDIATTKRVAMHIKKYYEIAQNKPLLR